MKFTFLLLVSFLAWVNNISANPTTLKFKKRSFKIVQFTDLHWISGSEFANKNDSTAQLMTHVIRKEKPDLVILTGDVVVSLNALEEWTNLVQPMIRNKVPYAVTFGNHDTETDVSTKDVLEHLERLPYNVTYNADNAIAGVGNCILPIFSSEGIKKQWAIYLFDSHAYPEEKMMGEYDWIKYDQIQWYRDESSRISKENQKVLPSLAFFHIPTPEFSYVKDHRYTIGTKGEDVSAPMLNSGLIGAFLEKKDVLGVFVGHDHNNDFIGNYKDKISLAYGRKTGYAAAYHEILERGARVITIYEDEKRFDTYIRTLADTVLNYSYDRN